MKQKQIKKPAKQESQTSELKERLAAENEKEIAVEKVIKVYYNSCCGCGCSSVGVYIKVPEDSPLEEGQSVSESDINFNRAAATRKAAENL
jgi:hypothetical protein